MQVSRRDFLKLSGLSAAGAGLGGVLGFANVPATFAQQIDPAYHVLNRTTWGMRPQDLARVHEIGIPAWIEFQLDYAAIPDPLVDEFIAQRRALTMPWQELQEFAGDNYGVVMDAFLSARLYRAAYSERQLFEVMVEFWTDHLNVPAPDYLVDKIFDDRDVIRQHALGKFRDLILASAQSPAMLYYLDQTVSNNEHPNENYAREVMELHTLGVDGGYNEEDVVALARILTGWRVMDGSGEFGFDGEIHDYDEKTFLGVSFPAGRGVEDGLQAIDMLARHPSTAQFIARKLARKFVSDQPSQALIDSTAFKFIETDGDIKSVVRHLLTSDEFMAAAGKKYRRPMEFMVAAMRVLTPALTVNNLLSLVYSLEPMGHIPYHWFPPNGYPDAAGAWMNTNGLLHRWNTALTMGLAGDGLFEGGTMNIDVFVPQVATVGEMVDAAIERILGLQLPAEERAVLVSMVTADGDANRALDYDLRYRTLPSLIGVLMASPYFQWH